MNERKKILIALDGSAVSEAILRPIHPLIRRAEVETTLLHVAETSEAIQGLE
ncbi:MAG: universal stress protein, partial [Planctomycetes bacterium]|nr:universal stress protein [Planctomycetota bacterium]